MKCSSTLVEFQHSLQTRGRLARIRHPGRRPAKNFGGAAQISRLAPGEGDRRARAGRAAPARDRGQPTRERILDVAEQLFAHRGFHGVSVRDITGAAGVDVALANYSLRQQGRAARGGVPRRAEVLNAERLQRLEGVLARSQAPSLEDIIDAFTHPLLDRSERGGPRLEGFFRAGCRGQQLA